MPLVPFFIQQIQGNFTSFNSTSAKRTIRLSVCNSLAPFTVKQCKFVWLVRMPLLITVPCQTAVATFTRKASDYMWQHRWMLISTQRGRSTPHSPCHAAMATAIKQECEPTVPWSLLHPQVKSASIISAVCISKWWRERVGEQAHLLVTCTCTMCGLHALLWWKGRFLLTNTKSLRLNARSILVQVKLRSESHALNCIQLYSFKTRCRQLLSGISFIPSACFQKCPLYVIDLRSFINVFIHSFIIHFSEHFDWLYC